MTDKPIPKELLPHTVVLKKPVYDEIFENTDNNETGEIIIKNVRVEYNRRSNFGKQDTKKTGGAVIYYDAVNSKPNALSFEIGQFITFNNQSFVINAVRAITGAEKVHHYRLELL